MPEHGLRYAAQGWRVPPNLKVEGVVATFWVSCSRPPGRPRYPPLGLRWISRRFGDCLHSFKGAEHIPPVAALPHESAEWAPYLGEEVVTEVE